MRALGLWSILLASACIPYTAPESRIPRPLFESFSDGGNCGSQTIIDAKGYMWTEGGCEEGDKPYTRQGRRTSAQMQRLWKTLETLRTIPNIDAHCIPSYGYVFVEASGVTHQWAFCSLPPPAPFDAFLDE